MDLSNPEEARKGVGFVIPPEDHDPFTVATCTDCDGRGEWIEIRSFQVYEHGCGFPHLDADEISHTCETCNGSGLIGTCE